MGLTLIFPPSLGSVAASARAEIFGEWLAARLGEDIRVEIAPSYGELQEHVMEGRAQLAWAPPAVCALLEPYVDTIYKAVRAGRSSYRSGLVVRRGAASTVEELRGKSAAWVDRLSVGGHLLAVAHLRKHGLEPEHDLGGQRFYGSYQMALRAVESGDQDLTSVFVHYASADHGRAVLREQVGDLHEALDFVDFTDEAPTDGLVVGPGATQHLDELERLCALDPKEAAEVFKSLDAESLARAEPGDYLELADALRPPD